VDSTNALLRHGDKIVAGSCAAWLAGALFVAVASRPAAVDEGRVIEREIARLDDHERNWEVVLAPLADPLPRIRRELDPSAVGPVDAFGPWLRHRRPSFIFAVTPPEVLPVPIHAPPAKLHVVSSERHKVSLAWERDDAADRFVRVTGMDVERRDGDEGTWTRLATLGPAERAFVDSSAPPRTRLSYRIVEHAELDADDPHVHLKPVTLSPEEAVKAVELADPVQTLRDIFITFSGGSPDDPIQVGAAGKARGTFCVWLYDRSGKLSSKTIPLVLRDDTIGAGGFATGARLVGVRIEKRPLPTSHVEVSRAIATVLWPWGEEDLVDGELPPDLKK
jgi:hypothetical protein